MTFNKIMVFVVSIVLFSTGCSQKASAIKANYVSPLKYDEYSCNQLKDELTRINQTLSTISTQRDSTNNKDTSVKTVGFVIFPVALFGFTTGDDKKEQIANLKGEYDAIRINATRKKCDFAPLMK